MEVLASQTRELKNKEAFARSVLNAVDSVILDMIMPGISGKQIFRQIHQEYPALPVILASGLSTGDDIQEMKGQGLAGFLHKPFARGELAQLMNEIFCPEGK